MFSYPAVHQNATMCVSLGSFYLGYKEKVKNKDKKAEYFENFKITGSLEMYKNSVQYNLRINYIFCMKKHCILWKLSK